MLCTLFASQEADLRAAKEEAEAQQSALKVVAHVYQEKLAAARAACVVPLDAVVKEVRAVHGLSCRLFEWFACIIV